MKRFLFSFALTMGVFVAQAQINLEHSYTGSNLAPFKLSTGEVKYAEYFASNNEIRVYNQDHSLFKTIPTPAPANSGGYLDILVLSDKLFDADSGLECLISASNGANGYNSYVLDENGVELLKVADSGYAEVYNTPVGAKLFVYSIGATDFTKVYSLPGTYTILNTKGTLEETLVGAFPNPASELVNLPYSVKTGQMATLEVVDQLGRVVSTHQVTAAFSHLALRTSRLHSGAYFYRVTDAAGATTVGRRFVVTH